MILCCPCMHASKGPSVLVSGKFVNTVFYKPLGQFCQIYDSVALGDKDELSKF